MFATSNRHKGVVRLEYYSQAPSQSFNCLGRDRRQSCRHWRRRTPNCSVHQPMPGTTAGPYRCLSRTAIFKFLSREFVLQEKKHLYYNAIMIFGYQESNFISNQPSCELISDPSSGHPEHALVPHLILPLCSPNPQTYFLLL